MDIEISHRIRQLGNGSLAIYGTIVSHTGIVSMHFNCHNQCLSTGAMDGKSFSCIPILIIKSESMGSFKKLKQ